MFCVQFFFTCTERFFVSKLNVIDVKINLTIKARYGLGGAYSHVHPNFTIDSSNLLNEPKVR